MIKICYTLFMPSPLEWSHWADTLRRLKLDGLASWLLEAGAPLTVLGAQMLYIGQPFFGGREWNSFAKMLEEEDEVQAFARYLRDGEL
jgi:hypothetical protein